MRIGFVADVHLGSPRRFGGPSQCRINQRGALVLDALRGAVRRAHTIGCDAFVVLGDLFDDDHPPPPLLAAAAGIFADAHPMQVVLLGGNHDQHTTTPGDHALGPLAHVAAVLDSPGVYSPSTPRGEPPVQLLCVPFMPEEGRSLVTMALESMAPALARDAAVWPSSDRVLCVHLGIRDDKTPSYLQGAEDSIHVGDLAAAARGVGCRRVFAGNWHNHAAWEDDGVQIVQVGALAPTGWDNPGLDGYGVLAILDTRTGDVTLESIPGPRFVTFPRREDVDALLHEARLMGHTVYGRAIATSPDDLGAWVTALTAARTDKRLAAFDVVLDPEQARAIARAAADKTRAMPTLERAVETFVGAMALPDDVPRDVVQARSLALLRGTAQG